MEETLHFKVSSGLKDIIGRDLITNELVAIFELVKNSYDADSSNIEIVINSFESTITISDDGIGMDYDDIKNKWLFVAHSEKKDQTKRVYAGSKGIGRFSCDRLGSKLDLFSRKNDEMGHLSIDWGNFEEDSLKKFEDLNVMYYTNESIDNSFVSMNKSGTVLKISSLRDTWTTDRVIKVISALQRLINPFVVDDKVKINVKYISNSSGIEEIDEIVKNNVANILDEKTIHIEGKVNANKIEISLVDKNKKIYLVELANESILENVVFKVYYMSFKAKNNFTRIMGVTAKEYGSIFLYKNDFRIFPYGEPDFDSFGLNSRKAQGYNRYLGHRELLGWINITDSANHFKEVSSRDGGFVSNEYTFQLERMYMELIQRPLESYVQLVNFGDSEIDDIQENEEDVIGKLLNRFKKYEVLKTEKYEIPKLAIPLEKRLALLDKDDIKDDEKKEIQRNIKQAFTETKREAVQAKKERKKFEKENEKLQSEIEVKEIALTKENPERQKMLFHELGKVSRELNGALKYFYKHMTNEESTKFSKGLVGIRKSSDKLSSIKKQILRLNFETFSKKETIELRSYLESYLKYASDESTKINLKLGKGKIYQEVNVYDLGVLFDNLILNAMQKQATTIDIYFSEDYSSLYLVTDTAPIEIRPIENIFKLGVTSTKRGTGIGMYLCAQICQDFKWKISVSEVEDKFVKFKIDFGETK